MRSAKDMPYHRGLVVKLYPTNEQKRLIAVNDGAKRAVYNFLVATNNELYQLRKVTTYCKPIVERITYLKDVLKSVSTIQNAMPFLYSKDVDSMAVANAKQNYHTAWKNQKERHTGVPRFKKKGDEQSYQTNGHYDKNAVSLNESNLRFISKHRVKIPILGIMQFSGSPEEIEMLFSHTQQTRISSVRIYKDSAGEYWASFSLTSEYPFYEDLPKTGSIAGLDLNLINLASTSAGEVYDNPHYMKKAERKLKKAQRKLSRQARHALDSGRALKDCKNYQEQRKKVAKIHRQVARQRKDCLHVLSKREVENQDFLAAEDLQVKNLLKNHVLAKAISDAGWRTLLTMLSYKASWYGKEFVLVPPQYTSQACSNCGYVLKKEERLPLSVREWDCPFCGAHHNRDINAAQNILNKALQQARYA